MYLVKSSHCVWRPVGIPCRRIGHAIIRFHPCRRTADLVNCANLILMSLGLMALKPRSDGTFAHASLRNVSLRLAGNPV